MSTKEEREKYWIDIAKSVLLNRKIVEVRYLTEQEMEMLGWYKRAVVFILDDGTIVYPSQDDEGNNAGALFYQKEDSDDYVLPVIS
jgi:hypothetical protein